MCAQITVKLISVGSNVDVLPKTSADTHTHSLTPELSVRIHLLVTLLHTYRAENISVFIFGE